MRKEQNKKCEVCDADFLSRKKVVRFCSNKCRAKKIKINQKLDGYGNPYNYDYKKIRECKICNKTLHAQNRTGHCKEHYITEELRKKRSEIALTNKYGGYKQGSGRGKHGWYKGYWCDSSWELAFVIFNLEHNINFERNTKKFEYIWKDKVYRWIPDFIINNVYYEIKGFSTLQNEAKFICFNHPLKILYKNDMVNIIKYVVDKYGKDFISLYEIIQI